MNDCRVKVFLLSNSSKKSGKKLFTDDQSAGNLPPPPRNSTCGFPDLQETFPTLQKIPAMKWIIPCLWALLPSMGFAQYDSLLHRSFNERFPVLLRHFEGMKRATHSTSFGKEWQEMTAFAQSKGDQKWVAELQAIHFKYTSAGKTASALYHGL